MPNLIVAGIGTDVGKTVASAILTYACDAEYFKPFTCGDSDTDCVAKLIPNTCYQPQATSGHALSPHAALELDGTTLPDLSLPSADRLVIEMAGGIMTPMRVDCLAIDYFSCEASWVVVSRHTLGSINHTLLTLEALARRGIKPFLIFNGEPNPESERAIIHHYPLPVMGRLLPEKEIDFDCVRRYARQWKPQLIRLLPKEMLKSSGTPTPSPKLPQTPSPSSQPKAPTSMDQMVLPI